jgi:hypothetical protein
MKLAELLVLLVMSLNKGQEREKAIDNKEQKDERRTKPPPALHTIRTVPIIVERGLSPIDTTAQQNE